ncbi:hypothetical protein SLEP1_g26885 [Rubroshorea leprosula]|uniref:Uncharacterized protein n=1 Tax=Rubroshorea leprosula TaxID=152421 RepID=A0AAV5JNE7_9ROSI|nr:hypothetical protein SLEP1_g26885 [Rubroshorea leprosula]
MVTADEEKEDEIDYDDDLPSSDDEMLVLGEDTNDDL